MLKKIISNRISADDAERLISRCRELILQRIQPEAIYLFGSAARGELTTASDLDVAIILPSQDAIRNARKKLCGVSAALDWSLDVLYYTPELLESGAEAGGVCEIIVGEGRKIYDSKATV